MNFQIPLKHPHDEGFAKVSKSIFCASPLQSPQDAEDYCLIGKNTVNFPMLAFLNPIGSDDPAKLGLGTITNIGGRKWLFFPGVVGHGKT